MDFGENYISHDPPPLERAPHSSPPRPYPFSPPLLCHVIVSGQWGVSLQAQCGCRDVRSNGDGRDGFGARDELDLTKQKRIAGSLNVLLGKHASVVTSGETAATLPRFIHICRRGHVGLSCQIVSKT